MLTKLQAGGISPLALINRGFQVVIDQSAQLQTAIHISGGQRGLNIRLPVVDLQKLTNARLAEISRDR
jgi:Cys-tRNA(Pro)/Cys-tRNA(Cys) deacylase